MQNINKFCEETGMKFEDGAIGIGRDCVGIYDPRTRSFLCYWDYLGNPERGHKIAQNEQPKGAYNKDCYLAVLCGEENDLTKEEATSRLDEWIGKIIESGYEVIDVPRPTLTAMMGGGMEKLLTDAA